MIGENAHWQVGDLVFVRYRVNAIAEGGMGLVYLVADETTGEKLAIKTFRREVFERSALVADRFIQEAVTWIRLDRHPNVVSAHYARNVHGVPFLFLEYVEGGDLSASIGTPLLLEDPGFVVSLAIQFCDGMNYALRHGVAVHRDVKPQNCLLTSSHILKVTDFGLAKAVDWSDVNPEDLHVKSLAEAEKDRIWRRQLETGAQPDHVATTASPISGRSIDMSRTGQAGGTPAYMAPEQFGDLKHVDMRADVYSFGVMLYEMLTGQLPFQGRSFEELEYLHRSVAPPAVTPQVESRYSGVLSTVVARCLAKEPAARYQGFDEIRSHLADILGVGFGYRVWDPPAPLPMSSQDLVNKAVGLLELAHVHEALQILDRVIEQSPSDPLAWKNKGLALMSLNRWEDALDCQDRAILLRPNDMEIWFRRGLVLERLERWVDALDSYMTVNKAGPGADRYAASMNSALVLAQLGRHPESLAILDEILAMRPDDVPALLNRGTALGTLGRHAESLALFDRVLKLQPGFSKALRQRGIVLARLDRYPEALTDFEECMVADPADEEALFLHGLVLEQLGRLQEALASYVAAVRIGPRHPHARQKVASLLDSTSRSQKTEPNAAEWHTRGEALQQLGHWADSEACLARALQLHPGLKRAWLLRANVLIQLGRLDEAVNSADRALKIDSADPDAWTYKTVALCMAGHFKDGLIACERGLELVPHDATMWNNKARTLEALGRFEEALPAYDNALRNDPLLTQCWSNKGEVLNRLSRFEEAISCFERATTVDTNNRYAWTGLSQSLLGIERFSEAVVAGSRATEIDPQYGAAWMNLGMPMELSPISVRRSSVSIRLQPWESKGPQSRQSSAAAKSSSNPHCDMARQFLCRDRAFSSDALL